MLPLNDPEFSEQEKAQDFFCLILLLVFSL